MAIYNGKHCVFEQVNLDNLSTLWGLNSDVDDDGAINNYSISYIRSIMPNELTKLSSALNENITNTTYKSAKNGNSSTLLDLTDKLFLPAEKEINSSSTMSTTIEINVLTTWQYYVLHNTNADRIKLFGVNADNYHTRSPLNQSKNANLNVNTSGDIYNIGVQTGARVPKCFAF